MGLPAFRCLQRRMDFHRENFYSSTLAPFRDRGIGPMLLLDPYNRRLVCPFGHSLHRHFIDPRPNTHSHLWLALLLSLFRCSPHTERAQSAVFNGLLTLTVSSQRQPYSQGRHFRALHLHSTCHSISYCCFHSLSFLALLGLCAHKAFFPVR